MKRHSRHLTGFLAAACVLTAAAIVFEFRAWKPPVLSPPPSTPSDVDASPPQAFHLPPLAHYRNFVERPLFIKGRTPLPPAAATKDEAEPSRPTDWVLTGILETPDIGQIALLRSRDGKRHLRLRLGDEADGWRLSAIAPDHVVLQRRNARQTLQLLKPRPNPPVNPKHAPPPKAGKFPSNPFLIKKKHIQRKRP